MHRPVSRWCLLVLFLFYVQVVTACGAKQIPEPDDRVAGADALLAHVDERTADVHAARARAVMEYYGDEGRVRIRQALVVREPGDVRLETLSPFQSTLSVLITNADTLLYVDLSDERQYLGVPSAENLNKLIPLWLSPSDIVRVVLGGLPLQMVGVDRDAWQLEWDGHKGAWKLSATDIDGTHITFWLRHQSWVLAGAEAKDVRGDVIWEIRTRDYQAIAHDALETEYPERIRFLMPSENIDVSLHIQEYTLNPQVGDALFTLDLPDFDTVNLDGPSVHVPPPADL